MKANTKTSIVLPYEVPGGGVALNTLVDLCRTRVAAEPDRQGFVFLADGTQESESTTLAALDLRARAIAVRLLDLAPAGSRALLSFQPGLDFHAAFLGCLYAGLIAVPIAPLEGTSGSVKWTRVESVAASSRPRLFLSTGGLLAGLSSVLAETDALSSLTTVAVDEVDPTAADVWVEPRLSGESVAYLQYSSGSTGAPKGVTLTHTNVLSNLALIHESSGRPSDVDGMPRPPSVLWLPSHYNMGLLGGVLDPLFSGREAVLMPAKAFVRRPVTWLRTISRLGRADSCAPNFALDLCVRRVGDAERDALDLSGWEMALIGGEPVRAETLRRFVEKFAPAGFRAEALVPGYGLAESTVMVTAGPVGTGPVLLRVEPGVLAMGRARPVGPGEGGRLLVSSGAVPTSALVVVVDRGTGQVCRDGFVGEVLVAGPSVGAGYWNAPPDQADPFDTALADYPGKRFLRTGDLGFRYDGELFVTGRAKEVVIIAGANHYPHDIEATVEASHPAVRPQGSCAFAVDDGERERLVVLVEVVPPADPVEVGMAVRRAVHSGHGIQAHEVVLLRPGALPFTTNGKLRRGGCQDLYRADSLGPVTFG